MSEKNERFQQALERAQRPPSYPPGYPEKGKRIQEDYKASHYNPQNNPPSEAWEIAFQVASNLQLVINNPGIFDRDGSETERYQNVIDEFNVETGLFPDHIDPRTGRVKE